MLLEALQHVAVLHSASGTFTEAAGIAESAMNASIQRLVGRQQRCHVVPHMLGRPRLVLVLVTRRLRIIRREQRKSCGEQAVRLHN